MSGSEETISGTITSRFRYGTTDTVRGAKIFFGAVIYGTDLTYDSETDFPSGGTVDRIELQTRAEDRFRTVHGIYSDINASTQQLNNACLGADNWWFDPVQFFSTDLLQTSDTFVWTGSAVQDIFHSSDRLHPFGRQWQRRALRRRGQRFPAWW